MSYNMIMNNKVVKLKTKHARQKKLNISTAQKKINNIAVDPKNIKYGAHARERFSERSFSIKQAERILQKGFVMDEPRLGDKGDWSYLVRFLGLEGTSREAACATIIVNGDRLFVKTIEWVDL